MLFHPGGDALRPDGFASHTVYNLTFSAIKAFMYIYSYFTDLLRGSPGVKLELDELEESPVHQFPAQLIK